VFWKWTLDRYKRIDAASSFKNYWRVEAKGKGKRGQKPKNAAPESEGASADTVKRGPKRKRAATEPDTPESANAKMARMSEASWPSMGMIAPVARMMPQWPG